MSGAPDPVAICQALLDLASKVEQAEPGGGSNGAKISRAWTEGVAGRQVVLYVTYKHPWVAFPLGLRRQVDNDFTLAASGSLEERIAHDIYWRDIDVPVGEGAVYAVDPGGVHWWGEPPAGHIK
ncbi:hypothetical protein WDZ17_17040 [Pseudokineococcus basanitobsidens]|uniref:Uncharacterized protein n=1 Tax=Pseudokineococcus basanitobsidens TaxID=1926649 RepID=A0ABU8RPG6_9ACTN